MVASLDEIVGDVVALYRKNGLLENTIGFFVADNGGETRDGGNNWPLSGQKWTLLEGGLKATGFMFGGLVPLGKYNGLFHVTDILPTVMEAFNCPIDKKIDGYAQWGAMIKRKAFPRSELLHNIDPTKINKFANDSRTWSSDWDVRVQAALRKGPWKLITGDPGFTSDEVPEFPVPPPEWHQQEPYKNKTRGRISQITGKSADYYFENHRNKLVRLYKIDEDPTESRDIRNVTKILLKC
jgi:arylsulfatase A-like enzyme